MTQHIQTIIALAIVAIAAGWLVLRSLAKRKNPGCSAGCGCPSSEIKDRLRQKN